jgi:hypothetical protein
MLEELESIVFEPARENGKYLEKLFRIKNLNSKDTDSNYNKYDFSDPIDEKLCRIEEFFERYGVTYRVDFNELMNEMYILVCSIYMYIHIFHQILNMPFLFLYQLPCHNLIKHILGTIK